MYTLLRNFLFLFPPEWIHYFSMNCLKLLCSFSLTKHWLRKAFAPASATSKQLFGLTFRNAVGLAAGFDKNALYLNELEALGFGFVEIGTVTPQPQDGNEQPRLFRLPKDKALINRMGFNNQGVKLVAERLRGWKAAHLRKEKSPAGKRLIIGGNIGKNKITPNEDAWRDYEACFRELMDCVDYFVVNVSSPNTPGLRALQEKDALRKILSHLQTINQQQPHPLPLLLKIAPDLSQEQVNDVIDLALEIQLDGLVVANTSISRNNLKTPAATLENIGAGGLSGKPITTVATNLVQYITNKTAGSLPIIASGGIFTADDAKEKINAGAALVQVWTGFIYEGPGIVKKVAGGV
ncbi:MAG TPA: quinone-dependent dihydroorotate dehydrogenase [Chitinophagaceae bacterium]|nr:quinone-dependent dihydroorotate dehydrogenase [Chitinophagaceae bacterium]